MQNDGANYAKIKIVQNTAFTYNDSFLIRLLIAKKYQFYRHLFLVLIIAIIATNITVASTTQSISPLSRNVVYKCIILTIIYLSAGYFNLYILVPRLLLKHKYLIYILSFFAAVLAFVLIDFLMDYIQIKYYHVQPGKYSYYNTEGILPIEFISNTLAIALSISGASFSVLLRHWIISGERVNELEKNTLKSELEQLKNQINPHFLFNILNKTGTLAKKSPAEASQLLIKLSKLLRYQLYDSTRNTVLLSTEVSFLENFLRLEQIQYEELTFSMQKEGNIHSTIVPPLLFIPFVEEIVKRLPENGSNSYIHLSFEVQENQLIFRISSSEPCNPASKIVESQRLINVERRIKLLYNSSYSLIINERETACEICLILYFEKEFILN